MMPYKENVAIKVKEYLDNNFSEDITLKILSKKTFCCIPIMENSFKELYGETIFSYLNKKRFDTAKKYLAEGYYVNETARMVGYKTPTSFSHAYKKIYGVAPSENRRKFGG